MADMTVAVGILAAVGCVIILWLLADSLWNLCQGVKAHLLPYIQPSSVNLTEKFGSWAGRHNFILFSGSAGQVSRVKSCDIY